LHWLSALSARGENSNLSVADCQLLPVAAIGVTADVRALGS
jgi:hypothetical protein